MGRISDVSTKVSEGFPHHLLSYWRIFSYSSEKCGILVGPVLLANAARLQDRGV